MSRVDESSMSEVAQKEISKLRQQIAVQNGIIIKEEAVINEKGDSYICKRALVSLESATAKHMKHDRDYQERIEYFEDKYRKMIQRLEEELEQKKKETKSLFDSYKECTERDMEKHSKIIDSEKNCKSPAIIRARAAIGILQEKIEKIKGGWTDTHNREIVVPPLCVQPSNPHPVKWEEIRRQQLEVMSPAERQFFEESQNRKEEKEEVFTFEGRKVSKWEYNKLTAPPKEKYSGPKKSIKNVTYFPSPLFKALEGELEIPPI
jgi:hypothetical protein